MTVSSIVAAGGADYSTLQTWENDTVVTASTWEGSVDDNADYDETLTISGGTGTPTVSNYVWLYANTSNSHAGAWDTGKARQQVDTASGHAITVDSAFVRILRWQIKQNSPAGSDEAFRLNAGADDLLIERVIAWTDSTTVDTDGIYAGNSDISATIVNSLFYGWQRCGIHAQNFTGNVTQRWAIEHCSFYNNGSASEPEAGGIRVRTTGAATSIIFIINNTAVLATSTKDDYEHTTSSGAAPGGETIKVDWTGSNNADSDGSIAGGDISAEAGDTIDTNTQASLVATTVWTDPANGDFTVVNGQGLDDNGASFTSDDTRADVSVDIAGNARDGTTPDIGCFEEVAAASGRIMSSLVGSGGLAGSGGIAGESGGLAG